MDAATWLIFIVLGAVMGGAGQGARATVGMRKVYEDSAAVGTSFGEKFSPSMLSVSLLIGVVAGVLAMISLIATTEVVPPAQEPKLSVKMLLGVFAAGYAGTDFIEGFVRRNVPATESAAAPSHAARAADARGNGSTAAPTHATEEDFREPDSDPLPGGTPQPVG